MLDTVYVKICPTQAFREHEEWQGLLPGRRGELPQNEERPREKNDGEEVGDGVLREGRAEERADEGGGEGEECDAKHSSEGEFPPGEVHDDEEEERDDGEIDEISYVAEEGEEEGENQETKRRDECEEYGNELYVRQDALVESVDFLAREDDVHTLLKKSHLEIAAVAIVRVDEGIFRHEDERVTARVFCEG